MPLSSLLFIVGLLLVVVSGFCQAQDSNLQNPTGDFYYSSGGGSGVTGVAIILIDGKCIIAKLFKETGATTSGLQEGDQIIKVDHQDVTNLAIPEISKLIRGEPNTTVHLTILRPGEKSPKSYNLIRRDFRSIRIKG